MATHSVIHENNDKKTKSIKVVQDMNLLDNYCSIKQSCFNIQGTTNHTLEKSEDFHLVSGSSDVSLIVIFIWLIAKSISTLKSIVFIYILLDFSLSFIFPDEFWREE